MSFIYLTIERPDPPPITDIWAWMASTVSAVEQEFLMAGMMRVERLDLLDGRRVYRVDDRDALRLVSDELGPYVWTYTDGKPVKLRFLESFPAGPILRPWLNIT